MKASGRHDAENTGKIEKRRRRQYRQGTWRNVRAGKERKEATHRRERRERTQPKRTETGCLFLPSLSSPVSFSLKLCLQCPAQLTSCGCLLVLNPQVPLDILAADWLNDTALDTRTRVYLVESCLGHVILALEKLLREAEKRGVLSLDADADDAGAAKFNAINFLAQQLMRSNPRFTQLSDNSPYAESMRVVERELRDRVYASAGDRAAARQAELERRQEKFEAAQADRVAEAQRRLGPALAVLPRVAYQRAIIYDTLLALDARHVAADPIGARLFPQLRANQLQREGAFADADELRAALAPHLLPLDDDTVTQVTTALATAAAQGKERRENEGMTSTAQDAKGEASVSVTDADQQASVATEANAEAAVPHGGESSEGVTETAAAEEAAVASEAVVDGTIVTDSDTAPTATEESSVTEAPTTGIKKPDAPPLATVTVSATEAEPTEAAADGEAQELADGGDVKAAVPDAGAEATEQDQASATTDADVEAATPVAPVDAVEASEREDGAPTVAGDEAGISAAADAEAKEEREEIE